VWLCLCSHPRTASFFSAVNAVLFAAGGDVVLTAGYDQSVRVWDTRSSSFEAIQVLAPFKDSVTSLALHDACILAGSVDGTVRSFDVRTGQCTVDEVGAPVTTVALSRDGACVLAALAGASRLRLLDRAGGSLLAEYEGHLNAGARCGAALTADDARVVAGGEDGRVHIWELVDATVDAVVDAHPGKTVCGLDCHPSTPAAMLTCATDGLIKVWEAP